MLGICASGGYASYAAQSDTRIKALGTVSAAYYGTKRGNHPRSDQRVPLSSYDLMIGYDSFSFQHLISPRPLLMIAGSDAETLHYSKSAVEGAKEPKGLFVVDGKNHFELYDDLDKSAPKLVEFYTAALTK
ncbi:hypothetical protein ISF_09634 [Cordyceps fumosorosea ARSEF 2679]|uniref:Dienelactone hydrolase domain-containing protein n=1 Tax=Cordyceps fumosorosea (strain ARSEF 2679) TaxID=1081104 RepID=A0A162LTN0_CORFA|nr:hypothetical protein ISF_09634 [Cordyceps fumosorosea ARSEF 2679]OAA44440.1 hypothetical protein ISF_09634 [Cordyceps fumosorosea ARSEF 2679]